MTPLNEYNVIDTSNRSKKKLEDAKIVSIDVLISSKQAIYEERFGWFAPHIKHDLLTVITVLETWRSEGKTDDDILNDLTEEEFDRISRLKAEEAKKELRRKMYDEMYDEIILKKKKRNE